MACFLIFQRVCTQNNQRTPKSSAFPLLSVGIRSVRRFPLVCLSSDIGVHEELPCGHGWGSPGRRKPVPWKIQVYLYL